LLNCREAFSSIAAVIWVRLFIMVFVVLMPKCCSISLMPVPAMINKGVWAYLKGRG